MSAIDPKTLERARGLLKKGDLEGAVRAFVAAQAHEEAARALAAAGRFVEAANLLLASLGVGANELASLRTPQLRARAGQAAALLRQGGMSRAADDVEDQLEATSQQFGAALMDLATEEKTVLARRPTELAREEKTQIARSPLKPAHEAHTVDTDEEPPRPPPGRASTHDNLPSMRTPRPAATEPAHRPAQRTGATPPRVITRPPERRPQMVEPLPPEEAQPRRPSRGAPAVRADDTPPRPLPAAPYAEPPTHPSLDGFETGTVVAERYRLGPLLGQGGFGRVFRATDLELNQDIAIKVFDRMDDATLLARFKQELLSSRQIAHPNVLRIFDIGTHADQKYLTMELLVGHDLKERLTQPIAFSESLDLLIQSCRGLEAAHAVGVIHRDIKPQNLFITTQKVVKLMDFGIAKLQAAARLTSPGMGVGTPEFMAPEQILDSSAVSPATDLYAIGVTAYRMLTGRVPFQDKDILKLLKRQLNEEPPAPRQVNPRIPAQLEAIVLKLMAKRPEQRYASAGEAAEAFAAVRARFQSHG